MSLFCYHQSRLHYQALILVVCNGQTGVIDLNQLFTMIAYFAIVVFLVLLNLVIIQTTTVTAI